MSQSGMPSAPLAAVSGVSEGCSVNSHCCHHSRGGFRRPGVRRYLPYAGYPRLSGSCSPLLVAPCVGWCRLCALASFLGRVFFRLVCARAGRAQSLFAAIRLTFSAGRPPPSVPPTPDRFPGSGERRAQPPCALPFSRAVPHSPPWIYPVPTLHFQPGCPRPGCSVFLGGHLRALAAMASSFPEHPQS